VAMLDRHRVLGQMRGLAQGIGGGQTAGRDFSRGAENLHTDMLGRVVVVVKSVLRGACERFDHKKAYGPRVRRLMVG